MRILYIINSLSLGGAEKLLVDALPYFKAKGLDVAVLQLSSEKSEQKYLSFLKEKEVPFFTLNAKNIYSPKNIFSIKKFIKKNNFDVVHVHLFPAMYWASLAKKNGAKISMIFTEHSTQNNRFNKFYFKPVDKFIYKSFDKIIAISPTIQQKLIDWTGLKNKVILIRNGVDATRFLNANPYTFSQLKQFAQIPEGAKLLMMTARFLYPKDQKTIIDALKFLPENYHAIFIGEGDEKNNVMEYATSNNLKNRTHFLGFRNDVAELMKSVDVNILSSLYEGMSGVTCEAMASGKPFLGTDVPGINDVVPDERFLFQVQNAKQLAEKIIYLLNNNDYRNKTIADASEYVKQFYMENMIDEYIRVYEEVIDKFSN